MLATLGRLRERGALVFLWRSASRRGAWRWCRGSAVVVVSIRAFWLRAWRGGWWERGGCEVLGVGFRVATGAKRGADWASQEFKPSAKPPLPTSTAGGVWLGRGASAQRGGHKTGQGNQTVPAGRKPRLRSRGGDRAGGWCCSCQPAANPYVPAGGRRDGPPIRLSYQHQKLTPL